MAPASRDAPGVPAEDAGDDCRPHQPSPNQPSPPGSGEGSVEEDTRARDAETTPDQATDAKPDEDDESRQKKKPRLRLDREALARISSDERWSREVKERVEAYRRDVRAGVNPFDGAFPLWRNEQFVAATTEALAKKGDSSRLATFAEMEQAVLLEAQRRELRLLNRRDAAARGDDLEEERATCTAVTPMPPVDEATGLERANTDLHTLAKGLGEDDGEELELEGDAALEEGLRGDERDAETEKDAATSPSGEKRFPSVLSDPAALRDPFLVAAAEAAAGDDRPARKSLQLGRRWYDGNQYPGGDEKTERGAPPGLNPAGAGGAGATRSDSGGSGAGGSGSGSGSGEAEPARPLAAFTRPPRLFLYPDGSMGEAPLPGAAAMGSPLAPTASLEANASAPPPGFQPSERGSATPFAYHPFAYPPPPWAFAQMPGQMFAPPMPPNATGFAPTVPPGFPPHPAALFGFPPGYFAHGVPFPPAAPPFSFPMHPANAATFDARAVPSGSDGPGGAGSDGSGGSSGSGGTKVSSGPGYRSERAAPKNAQTRMTKTASAASRGKKKGVTTKKRPNAGGADENGEKKARAAEKNIDDAADCLQMLSSGGTD